MICLCKITETCFLLFDLALVFCMLIRKKIPEDIIFKSCAAIEYNSIGLANGEEGVGYFHLINGRHTVYDFYIC